MDHQAKLNKIHAWGLLIIALAHFITLYRLYKIDVWMKQYPHVCLQAEVDEDGGNAVDSYTPCKLVVPDSSQGPRA